MSELIQKNDNRATIRWKLLTGASAMALTASVAATSVAKAEDADKPQIWLELGGQMDMIEGQSSPFTAPFMFVTPTPGPYKGESFVEAQHPPRISMDLEGKISFQPEDSDWIFSAGIRYGRSHSNKHVHHQTRTPPVELTFYFAYYHSYVHYSTTFKTDAFADTKAPFGETHQIVDFQVGKDVGLGLLGNEGTSQISAGVRFAQFRNRSRLDIHARPEVDSDILYATLYSGYISFPRIFPRYYLYEMHASATRSFKGVGPSLSWNGSAVIAGNSADGELVLDFGVNAALLFGRQKAKTEHGTQTHHRFNTWQGGYNFGKFYTALVPNSGHRTDSRNVTVPNVGAFAGLSYRYADAKLSIGYRYDTFLNAMDTGIDAAKKSNLTFNGPYASISIGIGD